MISSEDDIKNSDVKSIKQVANKMSQHKNLKNLKVILNQKSPT